MGMSHIPGVSENDALSLEYKLVNRDALRQADISDFIGDAALKGCLRIHILHFQEETVDYLFRHAGMTSDYAGD